MAFFLLISAVAHFYLASIGYGRYVENLKKGMNPVRFYEYALSSSLMIVLIGMLIGIWDLGAIILIFTVNATMNLFGIMMELHNQDTKKTDWTAFIYGCIAGIVPWIVIMLYFVGAVNSGDAKPPAFVYTIVPTRLFFSTSSPSTWSCSTKVSPWKDYLFGERAISSSACSQDRAVLADLDRHPGPCIKSKSPGVCKRCRTPFKVKKPAVI